MEQLSKDAVGEIIKKLWKEGKTPSQIGMILKEKYNIYDIRHISRKKLKRFMKDLGLKEEIPEDLLYIFKKINRMLKHLEKNKKDIVTKKSLEELESYAKVLIKYYKKKKILPESFEYSRDIAKMYGSS